MSRSVCLNCGHNHATNNCDLSSYLVKCNRCLVVSFDGRSHTTPCHATSIASIFRSDIYAQIPIPIFKKKKQFSRYRTFSFLIVRTVDRARKFHVLAYACVTNETSLDYEFLFKTMIVAVKIIHNVQLNPNVLLADGDRAIRNGFVASFLNVDANVICARANKCK